MNTKKIKLITLSIVLLFFAGCQVVYEPDNISSNEKIIVIEGSLNDIDSRASVNVSYASAFGNNGYTYIKTASVWLKDDNGNSYPMSLSGNTYYLSTSSITFSESTRYYIHVETDNGKIYESEPQSLPGYIDVEDMYAEIGEYVNNSYNELGEVITQTFDGLFLYMSIKSDNDTRRYIRFENTAIYQSAYSYHTSISTYPIIVRCIKQNQLNSLPIIGSTFATDNGEEITGKNIGFVAYEADYTTLTDTSTTRLSTGWVIISNTYSLSSENYNYYEEVNDQLSADSKMFDPVPSQIIGNIKCISDSNEVVLGNFEVSRGVRKYYAFNWSSGGKTYKKKELESYNAPSGTFCTDTVPDFDWITFY